MRWVYYMRFDGTMQERDAGRRVNKPQKSGALRGTPGRQKNRALDFDGSKALMGPGFYLTAPLTFRFQVHKAKDRDEKLNIEAARAYPPVS